MNKSALFLDKLRNILYTAIGAFKRNEDENLNEDIRPDVRETVKLIYNQCTSLIEGNHFNEFFSKIDDHLQDIGINRYAKYYEWVIREIEEALYEVFGDSMLFSIDPDTGEYEWLSRFIPFIEEYYARFTNIKVPALMEKFTLTSYLPISKWTSIDFSQALDIESISMVCFEGSIGFDTALSQIIFNQSNRYSKLKEIDISSFPHIYELMLPKASNNLRVDIHKCESLNKVTFNDSPTDKGSIYISECPALKSVSLPVEFDTLMVYAYRPEISSVQPNATCKVILEDMDHLDRIWKLNFFVPVSKSQLHPERLGGEKRFIDSVELRDKSSQAKLDELRNMASSKLNGEGEPVTEILKDTVGKDTLRKRRKYYLTHGITTSGLLESGTLDVTTPYMLRIDGELLRCGDYHPYIKEYASQNSEDAYNYLIVKHPEFLGWFYENSICATTKEHIRKLLHIARKTNSLENILPDIQSVDTSDSIDRIISTLWLLTNQEFCRVRTSNYRYRTGGNNGEIYFRISSTDFNWFDNIWMVCVTYCPSIEYITIMRDPQVFGKPFDYIEIKGNKINKFPIKDFIELEVEPLAENRSLIEAHFGRGVDVDSLIHDWLDDHWEEFVDDEVENLLNTYDSLEELKEYQDLPENITTKEEAKKWFKDNVVNSRNYFNNDFYYEIAKRKICEELDNLWESAYNYFYDCCDEVVKKINEKILMDGITFDFDVSQSRSWSAGRWPSQYAEFTFRTDSDMEEDIQNDLDYFSCELRFSDDHDNGQYYGEEINWLDYNNPENCNWKETIFRVISDEFANLDDEVFGKVFGDGLDAINLNEKLAGSQISIKMSDKRVTENIEKHDTLNPLLFDEKDELREDVKEAISRVVNQFIEDLKADGVKIEVKDIILVGSNVSYNYTKDSDLDIHIIADKDKLDCDSELYTLLYGAYRSLFNKNYDITIKGIPVEIYVELA